MLWIDAKQSCLRRIASVVVSNRDSLSQKLSNNANEGDILLVTVDNDEIIRQISLFGNTQMRRRHAAMFGFAVIEHAQGKGVGSALIKVMIDYADKWTTFLRIELTVYAQKDSGIALYKKFGFEQEGLLRNYSLKNGRFENVIAMARFNPNQAIAKWSNLRFNYQTTNPEQWW